MRARAVVYQKAKDGGTEGRCVIFRSRNLQAHSFKTEAGWPRTQTILRGGTQNFRSKLRRLY